MRAMDEEGERCRYLCVGLLGDGEIPRADGVVPSGTVGLVGVGAVKEGARDLASVAPQDRDGGLLASRAVLVLLAQYRRDT